MTLILWWLALAMYSVATWLTFQQIKNSSIAIASSQSRVRTQVSLAAMWFAFVCHLLIASVSAFQVDAGALGGYALVPSAAAMTVMVGALLVFTYLVLRAWLDVAQMTLVIAPVAIASLAFSQVWNTEIHHSVIVLHSSSFAQRTHLFTSLAAYAFIALATIQGLFYKFHEAQLKNHTRARLLKAMPSLETMDQLLFGFLGVGIVLLSIAIASGLFFTNETLGVAFELNHHTLLGFIGWFLLCAIVALRYLNVMRGSRATKWLLMGFVLIHLGYFGTKMINEILL